jgi:hypothetical protein
VTGSGAYLPSRPRKLNSRITKGETIRTNIARRKLRKRISSTIHEGCTARVRDVRLATVRRLQQRPRGSAPAGLRPTNDAPSECNPLRSGPELDAVSLAGPERIAVLRARGKLKKSPAKDSSYGKIGGGPADYGRRSVRHAPGSQRERATLIALAQSASVVVARGERLHQAALMNS